MNLNWAFTLELLVVAVLIVVVVTGAIYIYINNRRGEPVPVREGGDESRTTTEAAPPRREFYKSMGLETDEDMKIRLYSLEDYENELGGRVDAAGSRQFVAALKSYRRLDDEWHEYSPGKAADILELAPEDYEVDGEHQALLLRRLPQGMPTAARDVL